MDSKGAIDLAQNPVHHKMSKHSRIKYHWIREQVGGKVVKLNDIPTAGMRADMMTKSLTEKLHRQLIRLLFSNYYVIRKLRGDRILCIFIE